MPSGLTEATNPWRGPFEAVWITPAVVGRSAEVVYPATYSLPEAPSRTIALGKSLPVPPSSVSQETAVPSAVSFATNVSRPPAFAVTAPGGLFGNELDAVGPATYAFPAESAAMAVA